MNDVMRRISYLFRADEALDLVQGFARFIPPVQLTTEQRESRDIYGDLNASNFETRFVTILPTKNDDSEICCQLRVGSLLEPPKQGYVAVSYCWGDPEDLRGITINGHFRKVTANLEAALRRLRTRERGPIWIDAICINQNNDFEKAYQVSRMTTIFSKARKVIAWLGETDHLLEQDLGPSSDMKNVSAAATTLNNLLSQPFFRRVWIVQEIAVAPVVEVRSGNASIYWLEFVESVESPFHMLTQLGCRTTGSIKYLRTLQHFRERQLLHVYGGRPRISLVQALIQTYHTLASDARDRVYALLALTCDGSDLVPTYNYSKPPTEVIAEAMQGLIVKQGHMTLILLAGARNDGCVEGTRSWLPSCPLRSTPLLPPWLARCFRDDAPSQMGRSETVNDELRIVGRSLEVVCDQAACREQCVLAQGLSDKAVTSIVMKIYRALWAGAAADDDIEMPGTMGADAMAMHFQELEGTSRRESDHFDQLNEWYRVNNSLLLCCRPLSTRLKLYTDRGHPYISRSLLYDTMDAFENLLLDLNLHKMKVVTTGPTYDSPNNIRIVPETSEPHDVVHWLEGCALPVVLRPSASVRPHYTVIGEVLGLSDDDPVWRRHTKQTLTLT